MSEQEIDGPVSPELSSPEHTGLFSRMLVHAPPDPASDVSLAHAYEAFHRTARTYAMCTTAIVIAVLGFATVLLVVVR